VHPLIEILLWEVHHADRNMLSNFQNDPIYRLGAMAKTSSGPVKMQQQQPEGADLNVETNACSLDLVRGHLHKEKTTKNHQPSPHATKGSKHATAKYEHATTKSTSQQPFDFRYVTKPCSSIA